ncbi:NUDIX hydrolase [Peribacillus simplex]|uniref:NUDIX hydrolase n=1 Tax=Peribacillus simplex TaxID=1478 RepID=UPI0011A54C8E|nr:NUDIX hydrolase [Peribacillus simplex]
MGYIEDLRKLVGKRPVILTGAKVLVFNPLGQILLQFRTDTKVWGLPGGLMELGESLEETALREVKEETGLTIGRLQFLKVISGVNYFIHLPNGDQFYSVNAFYITNEIIEGTLKPDGNEGSAVKFFSINQLPKDMDPEIKKEIYNYSRFCN